MTYQAESPPMVCYSCVTNGYDAVSPVDPNWKTRFILFHDNTINVPEGWEGVPLEVAGLSGISLNRYAKMLPHRLALPSDSSLYVDGNIVFHADPEAVLKDLSASYSFGAMPHPERRCAYADVARTLELGFVWPIPGLRAVRRLREHGVPGDIGLFECNILYRRHNEPDVAALGEAWWRAWQIGYPRDQALLIAAAHETGFMPQPLGLPPLRSERNTLMGLIPHAVPRSRAERLPRRLASELMLFRQWARP